MHISHKNKDVRAKLLDNETESCHQGKELGVIITSDIQSCKQCMEFEITLSKY